MTTAAPRESVDHVTTGRRRLPRRWLPGPPRRWFRKKAVVAAALAVVIVVASVVIGYRLSRGSGESRASNAADATSTATVTRRTLSSKTPVDGTLGYAGNYTVINQLGSGSSSQSANNNAAPAGAPATAASATGQAGTSPGIQLTAATSSPTPSATPTTSSPSSSPSPSGTPTPTPAPTPTPTPTKPAPRPRPTSQATSPAAPLGSLAPTAGPAGIPEAPAAGPGPSASTGGAPASGQSPGVVTALPAVGRVVHDGQSLYQVNGKPVALLYGRVPAYRSLSEGKTGADVKELNADLVALGYATKSQLSPASDTYTPATAAAVAKLQKHLGLSQTGSLPLGRVVFLPTAARVTTVQATLGAQISAGATVLQATSNTRQVTVNLDTSQQSDVKAGDDVTITLPDDKTTPGRVSKVGTVATSSGSSSSGSSSSGSSSSGSSSAGSDSSSGTSTVEVDVTPLHPAATGSWDQAPVQVGITNGVASNALVVPIDALQAQPGGGYAVDVVDSAGRRHLVPVSLGLFDDADGLVQVTGTRLQAGQRVVVPAQ